jgi:hypothetical protein
LKVDDASIEKLAAIAAQMPKGLLMFRDELAGLLANLARYSGGTDRQHWLQAWNGKDRRIDRVKAATPLIIDHWSISVLGGIQPGPFRVHITSNPDGSDGLAARFLHCWPDPLPPNRPARRFPWKRDDWASAAMQRLYSLPLARDERGNASPGIVPFSDDAARRFDDWRKVNFAEVRGMEGLLQEAWGKMPGQAIRIATVLELMAWAVAEPGTPEPLEISDSTLGQALALVDQFFKPMARRVYGEDGHAGDIGAARQLARHIRDNKLVSFNASKLRSGAGCPSILRRDPRLMDQACAILVEHGRIAPMGERAGDTKGRMSKDYAVNPMARGVRT